MHEALGLIPSTAGKEKAKKIKWKQNEKGGIEDSRQLYLFYIF
jgi:hypothetical protein